MGQRNRRASDYFDVYVVSMTITSHHTILVVKVWSTGRRQARAMVETTCDPTAVNMCVGITCQVTTQSKDSVTGSIPVS